LKKIIFLIFIFLTLLSSADFLDDDMDGVENSVDRCPNSSIVDIVNQNGCPIERVSLKDISTYDISIGVFKNKSDIDYTKSLSIGYIKGDFSVYLYTSKYEEDYSLKSNSISFTYKFPPSK